MEVLGIDIGGSGIKGALVDTETGHLLSERKRIPTPKKSTPKKIAKTVNKLVNSFNYDGPIGCSFPTVVINGKAITSGNIDKKWKGTQIDLLFEKATGHRYVVANDADLAGLAEMNLGIGYGLHGMVIMVTIGTGLGTGVFYNGRLIPNIELGRILGKDGKPIEFWAGDKARKKDGISWKKWGKRFDFFLHHVVRVFSPDHFILGGGASKKFKKYRDQLTISKSIHVAKFQNNAGIVGAAMAVVNQ